MVYRIVWVKKSTTKLEKLLGYLENNWSKRIASEFLNILNYRIKLISENPKIGMTSNRKKDVRKFLITKQIYLYYTIKGDNIKILTLFDTRGDPEKLIV